MTGFGIRAKRENSSTIRLMSSTCRTMVSVHCSKMPLSSSDDLAEFAADAFGRKLDRRQRILDFVGDAARDVAPGRGALRGDELGDVVERDDVAVARLAGLLGADANRQVALVAVAR